MRFCGKMFHIQIKTGPLISLEEHRCKLPLHSVLGWHGGCGLRACVGFTVYCSGFGFRAYEFHSRFMCYNAFPRITCLEDQWGFSKSIMVITGIAIWIIRVVNLLTKSA